MTLFSINFNCDCNQNNLKLLSCFWIVRYIGRRDWHGSGGGGGEIEIGKALKKGLYPKFPPLTLLHTILQGKHALVPPIPTHLMLNHVLKKKKKVNLFHVP